MPESPEVAALVDFIDQRVAGRAISAVDVTEFRVVKNRDRPLSSLVGARVTAVRRFGKHVGFDTSAGWLMVGFGRNGWIRWQAPADPPDTETVPELVRIAFDDASALQLIDRGDFLAVTATIVEAPTDVPGIAALGPDPLHADFSRRDLEGALGSRRKQIKALLQEQTSIAGIGNAYSDEILHHARLPHEVHASALDAGARERIFQAIVDVMRTAAADRQYLPPHRLKMAKVEAMTVHGRGGRPCPRCGTTIVDRVFAGAAAQSCPQCQS